MSTNRVERSGPLSLPGALLAPLSWVYGAAVAARNVRLDRGRGVGRIGAPVVSVGNLTVGGTGKTPLVADLARRCMAWGLRPVVAMRGYGAMVDRPGALGGRASDEQLVLERLVPGLRVVAGAKRHRSLLAAGEPATASTVVLLDDGFQHRALHRDLDLVLVDAGRPALSGRLLPAGWLREPPASLGRADAVIVTRAAAIDPALAAAVERWHGRPPLAWVDHRWSALDRFEPGHPEPIAETLSWLVGRRVAVLAGVGRPETVAAAARAAGAASVAIWPVRDHHRYTARSVAGLLNRSSGIDVVLTTLKDWVKVRPLWTLPLPVVVPRLELHWMEGRDALDQLLRARCVAALSPAVCDASALEVSGSA